MRLTKSTTLANTPLAFGLSFRKVGTYLILFAIGVFLIRSPLFNGNLLAIIGYLAFCYIIVGETPTGRSMLSNTYGVLFKKPLKMVVTELTTTTTLGHGIREIYRPQGMDITAFRLMTGYIALVYTVTSNLNQWSSEEDFLKQNESLKTLFNILEEGESYHIVLKQDSDTSMLKLIERLEEKEIAETDDLQRMSKRRKELLKRVATLDAGKSVQQHVILQIKPKNIRRTTKALYRASRLIRPATHPADVLLSAMGLEGGVNYCE